jgi:hypothetical protein
MSTPQFASCSAGTARHFAQCHFVATFLQPSVSHNAFSVHFSPSSFSSTATPKPINDPFVVFACLLLEVRGPVAGPSPSMQTVLAISLITDLVGRLPSLNFLVWYDAQST